MVKFERQAALLLAGLATRVFGKADLDAVGPRLDSDFPPLAGTHAAKNADVPSDVLERLMKGPPLRAHPCILGEQRSVLVFGPRRFSIGEALATA